MFHDIPLLTRYTPLPGTFLIQQIFLVKVMTAMNYYLIIKLMISACVIVAVSELSKTNRLVGSFLDSLPLVSILSILWLYKDTRDTSAIADLSLGIFFFVLPSLPMFPLFSWLLKKGMNFYLSLGIAILFLNLCYFVANLIYKKMNLL